MSDKLLELLNSYKNRPTLDQFIENYNKNNKIITLNIISKNTEK